MAGYVSSLFHSICLWAIGDIPGPLGHRLRNLYYRRVLLHLGENVAIDPGVHITNPGYVSIGDNVWIDKYAVINAGPPYAGERRIVRRSNPYFKHREGEVVIGPSTHIAPHTVINGHGGVHIEGDTTVAAGSMIYSLSHHHRDIENPGDQTPFLFSGRSDECQQALLSAPIVIRRGGALGLNSVMLPGSTIGRFAWVTVGSMVMDTIPDDVIASGRPATPVKKRHFAAGSDSQ